MSEVLELKNYRKVKQPTKRQALWPNEYYCQRCDGNQFRFRESGEIFCDGCGVMIKNLQAVPK